MTDAQGLKKGEIPPTWALGLTRGLSPELCMTLVYGFRILATKVCSLQSPCFSVRSITNQYCYLLLFLGCP